MYESFYNLTELPFQITPDSRFFFGQGPHKKALAYAGYGLNKAEGFVVITGEIGAGKTTLTNYLLAKLSGSERRTANIVSTNLESDNLLRTTANAFGIDCRSDDKSSLLKSIQEFLFAQSGGAARSLLIVDEVQNLPPASLEELRMLSNFQNGHKALLQIFLVGQPEFRDVLYQPSMEQLRQRVVASYHLGALDEQQTSEYIEHRLRKVGWQSDPIFYPDAFPEIYRASAGVPRRINLICDRLLMSSFLAQRHDIGQADVREVIAEMRQEKLLLDPRAPRVVAVAETPHVNGRADPSESQTEPNGSAVGDSNEIESLSQRVKELDQVMRDQERRIDQILAEGLFVVGKN